MRGQPGVGDKVSGQTKSICHGLISIKIQMSVQFLSRFKNKSSTIAKSGLVNMHPVPSFLPRAPLPRISNNFQQEQTKQSGQVVRNCRERSQQRVPRSLGRARGRKERSEKSEKQERGEWSRSLEKMITSIRSQIKSIERTQENKFKQLRKINSSSVINRPLISLRPVLHKTKIRAPPVELRSVQLKYARFLEGQTSKERHDVLKHLQFLQKLELGK